MESPSGGMESIRMEISLQGDVCGTTAAEATVSARDMTTMGPRPLSVTDTAIQGRVSEVPAGAGRQVLVNAYNASGKVVYSGTSQVDVLTGQVASTRLVLRRNTQNCPLTAPNNTGAIDISGTLDSGSPPPADAGTPDAGGPACTSTSLPKLTLQDCAGGKSSTYVRPNANGPELVVFGIYESRSDHSSGNHPEGTATVHVRRTTPHILVLSSYEPTLWTIDASPQARIESVILNGYQSQRVTGLPPNVPVINRSGSGYLSACAYAWPGDSSGCDTQGLVTGLRQLTSREVTAFAGCYRATEFTLEDAPQQCSPVTRPVTHEAACTPGQGALSTYVAPTRSAPELHLLGVYETHSNHSGGNHPEGAATIEVTRTAPLILALSSYEPVHWTVRAAQGTNVQSIIVNGLYPQRVTAPPGITVINRSGSNWLGAYAYAWPSSSGGSDTSRLVTALEQLTARPLSSFAGCYQATSFKLGE